MAHTMRIACCATVLIGACLLAAGCGSPDAANIELRKQNQALRDEVADLNRARDADRATISALESQRQTVASLPAERLDALFTTHGLKLGRLTGGADLDRNVPGDEAIKVYVTPTDRAGHVLKAAGSFKIEAFDLDQPNDALIGTWTFSTPEAAANWYGQAMLYEYVLTCPWQQTRVPADEDLLVKVTFTDELTGRTFQAQQPVRVKPPATTAPTTQSAQAQ